MELSDSCAAALLELKDELRGSLVYIDSGIADVIAWGAGADFLAGKPHLCVNRLGRCLPTSTSRTV